MQQPNWELANSIAIELVNRETDVNELEKIAAHVRVCAERRPEQAGEQLFALLATVARDGRYVVRTGRTLDYYRDLKEVCLQFLNDYRKTTPENGWELVATLGWACRLVRYYRSDEGETELAIKQKPGDIPERSTAGTVSRPANPPKPKPKVVSKRETITLMSLPTTGKVLARTSTGEEITCTGIPPYPPASEGDTCEAEVVRENGRALKARFKAWHA